MYIFFKELVHVFMEAWQVQNLQSRPADWRPREELQFESKDGLLLEFSLPRGRSVYFLERSSTDWVRLTHSVVGNLLYSKFTDLNVNLI